jgi:hypothetical protein
LSNITVVQVEFSVDDCPAMRVYVGDTVKRHRVCAIAPILWKVFLRRGFEAVQIFRGRKPISYILQTALYRSSPLSG